MKFTFCTRAEFREKVGLPPKKEFADIEMLRQEIAEISKRFVLTAGDSEFDSLTLRQLDDLQGQLDYLEAKFALKMFAT